MRMSKKIFTISSGIALIMLGIFLGSRGVVLLRDARCNTHYDFINTDIVCNDTQQVVKKTGYIETTNRIASLIKGEQQKNGSIEIAVYFRDLKNGPVFGINENAKFIPASLLKLPLAMYFFSLEEEQPGFLMTNLTYTDAVRQTLSPTATSSPSYVHQEFPLGTDLQIGQSYTIDDLLSRMLQYSDNFAYLTLLSYVTSQPGGSEVLRQKYGELGIIDPTYADDTITVRSYASIFRLLYHVSYLDAASSEKALSLLSKSDFNDGLVAGIPSGTRIAHKFGERELGNGIKQIHDCGIVYYPDNPYLICVMTKGSNVQSLTSVISKISGIVYDEVNSRKIDRR